VKQGKRTVRFGLFVAGLLLADVSFLVYLGNALALEAASGSIARAGVLGKIGGSIIAGAGILTGKPIVTPGET
jgi:hypothetical protein